MLNIPQYYASGACQCQSGSLVWVFGVSKSRNTKLSCGTNSHFGLRRKALGTFKSFRLSFLMKLIGRAQPGDAEPSLSCAATGSDCIGTSHDAVSTSPLSSLTPSMFIWHCCQSTLSHTLCCRLQPSLQLTFSELFFSCLLTGKLPNACSQGIDSLFGLPFGNGRIFI